MIINHNPKLKLERITAKHTVIYNPANHALIISKTEDQR